MGPVDLKGRCSTPRPRPLPALPACLSSGRFPWPTKCHLCTQAATWTITGTGIPHTIRILWPDLRWCDWHLRCGHMLNLWRCFPSRLHHVFYCLVCLKGLCFTLYASRCPWNTYSVAFNCSLFFYNVLEIKDLWKDGRAAMWWMIYRHFQNIDV